MTSTGKHQKRLLRHHRARARIGGTALRPRLSVFRSNRHVFAQLIDDTSGRTLASASDLALGRSAKSDSRLSPRERARRVGSALAEKAIAQRIRAVVFDRSGYRYHGQVAAVAEGARSAGLAF